MGDVIANPSGSWTPSTAEAYIDQQIATVTNNLTQETIGRQTGDRNLQTQLNSEMATRADQDANLNALINAGIREGGGVQFDTIPTQNSANGITSGGMYSTLRDPLVGFVDEEPTLGSENLVKSNGVLMSSTVEFSLINSDGTHFFNTVGWDQTKSCFLRKDTGLYAHFPDVSSTMGITDYIPVTGISTIHFKGLAVYNSALCVQYDRNLKILNVDNANDYGTFPQSGILNIDTDITIVSTNTCFVRFTSDLRGIPSISLSLPESIHNNKMFSFLIEKDNTLNRLIDIGDDIICNSCINSDGIEFYEYENWDDYKSCFLGKDTGIYQHYDIANGYVAITKYLPVKGLSSIQFKGHEALNTALCVEYDQYGNILYVTNSDNSQGAPYVERTIQLHDDTYFVRFTIDVRDGVIAEILLIDTYFKSYIEQQYVSLLFVYENILNKLTETGDNYICSSYINSDNVEFYEYENWDSYKSCYLAKNSGAYSHFDNVQGYVAITKYLPVRGLSSIQFKGYEALNTALCVEYDRYRNIIYVTNATTSVTETYVEKTIQLQSNTYYVRFTVDVRDGVMPKVLLTDTKFKSYIEQQDLFTLDKYFDNVDKTGITQYNPIEVIKYSAGLTSIFHEWAFCGDSLSSGANFDPYGSQGSNIFTDYTYSWCQRLIHMIGGANGANYSVAGWTTQSWITNVWDNDHDAYYVTNGQTEKFKTNKKQAYVIFLGTNDLNQSVTIGDISTDINLNDYTQNAETFAGRYGGIIQRIKSIQPSAKIFVITVPTYLQGTSESSGLNDVIRNMTSIFTNVFLIDAAKYTPSIAGGYVYMGHFSTAGYQWFAYLVASYIDYIIRSYPTSFKYVTIIGTSHDHGDL